MKYEWTLTALYQEYQKDLLKCETDFERIMCKTICEKEIREKAVEFRSQRKLTPGEEAILLQINGD